MNSFLDHAMFGSDGGSCSANFRLLSTKTNSAYLAGLNMQYPTYITSNQRPSL